MTDAKLKNNFLVKKNLRRRKKVPAVALFQENFIFIRAKTNFFTNIFVLMIVGAIVSFEETFFLSSSRR